MRKYRIQVRQGVSGYWYWRIIARSGQCLAHSESYDSKRNAVDTVKAVFGNEFKVEMVGFVMKDLKIR